MKKKILSVALAFVMLTASFAGSTKYDELDGLTNLITASAVEQNDEIKTKFDKTLLFSDDTAFDNEFSRLRDELIPQYKQAAERLDTISNVTDWLELYDECRFSVNRLENYGAVGIYLDGRNSLAIQQYNKALNLENEVVQIDTAGKEKLLQNDDRFLDSLLSDESLQPWYKMISDLIKNEAYTPSEDEKYLLQPAENARDSYAKIHSTLIDSDLIYETVTAPDGSQVEANYTNRSAAIAYSDNREYRKEISEAYFKSLKNYENTFAGIYNNFVSSSESIAQRLGYASVLDKTCREDGITPEIITNYLNSVKNNVNIDERNNEIKKKALGYNTYYSTDRSVAICKQPDQSFKFEDARDILTKALAPLGDEYIGLLNEAFDEGWIDVYPEDNKTSGAGTQFGTGTKPCIILNYTDNYKSLSDLAHELGHAINVVLINNNQTSSYNSSLDMFSCEIASLTNELLLVRYMEDNAKTDDERLFYITQEYNTIKDNFFGASMFVDLELQLRDIVNNGGVLTADKIDDVYTNIYAEYNPGIENVKNYEAYWTRFTQLYTPFYPKAYGFSISAACNVADNITNGNQKAIDNYMDYLKIGTSRSPNEIFALVGTNLTDPLFVQPLVNRCNRILDESEAIVNQK